MSLLKTATSSLEHYSLTSCKAAVLYMHLVMKTATSSRYANLLAHNQQECIFDATALLKAVPFALDR